MTNDELDSLAIELVEVAEARTGDVPMAAAVLYQASLSIMVTFYPPDQIGAALEGMIRTAHEDVLEALGHGVTKQ